MPARPPAAAASGRAAVLAVVAALVLAVLPAVAAEAGDGPGLAAGERRGKTIYLTGESPSGAAVTALMGEAAVEVPASALPCAGCHGRDGRGRPEGGVDPSDLTWEALTRPYEVKTVTGRTRGPYTDVSLKRAITLGIDSAGNEIDQVMPRYRLTQEDATDLIAYLHRLGHDLDPGIAADRLTVGVLLPPDHPAFAAAGAAVRRVVDAWAAHVNATGGVYSRRLAVRYLAPPAEPAAQLAAVEGFLDAEPTFALVASFVAGVDEEIADLAERRELPLIGPLTLRPDESFPLNRQVFYLDGGLPAQARALAKVAAENAAGEPGGAGARRAAVLHPAGGDLDDLAADLVRRLGGAGFAAVDDLAFPGDGPAAVVTRLRDAGADDVVLLAPGDEEAAFAAAARAAGWSPRLYLLGSLAGPELLAPGHGRPGRAFVAFGSLPSDRTEPGLARFREQLGGADVAAGATQIAAYAACDLLAEGLRRSGRDLSREGLIAALEDLRDHATGLLPPLSYGPNRRVGSRGAWVLEVGPEGPTRAEWVESEP